MVTTAPQAPIEILDSAAISVLIAHRFPFLLVDRIEIVEPGRRVIGRKRISAGEWWAEGATEQEVALPFGLVIKAMAQTSAGLMRDLIDGANGTIAYVMGVTHVRIRRRARPGEELLMELTLSQWRRGLCRAHGVAAIDGHLVASADLTTIVRSVE